MSENHNSAKKEAAFALAALMEIPFQYKATQQLNFLGRRKGKISGQPPLPPPPSVIKHDNDREVATASLTNASVEQVCPICLTNPRDMAFGCGHLTCMDCGQTLSVCPLCRSPVTTRIKLYSS